MLKATYVIRFVTNTRTIVISLMRITAIMVIIIIINVSNIPRNHEGTTENGHIEHCAHTECST